MLHKRKHKRIPLHYYLKVTKNESADQLGFMIDISEECDLCHCMICRGYSAASSRLISISRVFGCQF